MKVLVTGGAGFIGSHLVDELIKLDHQVIVYDNLEPQVHGELDSPPEYMADDITFIKNDIRNAESLLEVLKDVEVIFHLAAMVGVGQSMYQIQKYTDVNTLGTAGLLDLIVNNETSAKKIIVASSNTIYGEGKYYCDDCKEIEPEIRSLSQLKKKDWAVQCPYCGSVAKPIPTDEQKKQDCTSVYALSKLDEEKLCLIVGDTYGIDTTALRFFNTYGSRQALSNPYTGVFAIFATNLLCNNPPLIYEDGKQTRDFVHVKDICQALILSMGHPEAKNEVFNVGTGIPTSVIKVAELLCNYINPKIKPRITHQFRAGDIRHCYADIRKISKLGYKPKYTLEEGFKELVEWIENSNKKAIDKTSKINEDMHKRGLIK